MENVSIVLRTSPKHDLVKLGYQFARGVADLNYDNGTEQVVSCIVALVGVNGDQGDELITISRRQMLDFTLKEPSGTPAAKFCFAIVNRSFLRATLDSRWDLVSSSPLPPPHQPLIYVLFPQRTFTNTVELGGLPKTLVR